MSDTEPNPPKVTSPILAWLGLWGVGFLLLSPWVVRDADVFWHLATGREMWQTGVLLRTDPFSYLHAGQPWVNHEWLFQWMVWPWYQATGTPGLFLATALFLLMALLGTAAAAWRGGCSHWTILGSMALAGASTAAFAHPRPTALSLMLLAAVVILTPVAQSNLISQRASRLSSLGPSLVLGFLFSFWANHHATFPLGLLACGGLLLGGCIQNRFSLTSTRASALILGGCCALTLLNPFGWGVHFVPLKVAGSGLFRSNNAEWQPPDFSMEFWPLAPMVLLSVFGIIRGWRGQPGWAVVGLIFGILAFQSRRLIPWFGVAALPLMALGLEQAAVWARSRVQFPRMGAKVAPALLVLALLYGWWVGHRLHGPITEEVIPGLRADHGAFPVSMARRLQELAPQGRVFNDYNHGGYLHLAIGPAWKVGMDGRNDLFGEEAVKRYTALAVGAIPALEEFDRLGVDAALLSWDMAQAEGGIYMQLAPDKRWACAGFDDSAILLVRRRSVSPDVLAKYELRHYIPILDWNMNLSRARANRQLPALRTELEALARQVPSWRGLQAAALAAEALRDETGAKALRQKLWDLYPITR